jgi:hypothetical protein
VSIATTSAKCDYLVQPPHARLPATAHNRLGGMIVVVLHAPVGR